MRNREYTRISHLTPTLSSGRRGGVGIMIEEKVLQNLGLNEKQAKVYLALLELGKATVVEIAKKSGLKRPTTYVVLDDLKTKGLVSAVPEKKRTLFTAEAPAVLEKNSRQNLNEFHEMLPLLRARYNRGAKPKIRFYDNKDVIENLYYNEIFPAKKIYFYGTSIKKLNEVWPKMLAVLDSYCFPKKKKKLKNTLEIVGNEPDDIAYAKKYNGIRQVRILPPGKKFLADSAIADDKILITSLDNMFAVMIESPDLADTYRAVIELAWLSAIPYPFNPPSNSLPRQRRAGLKGGRIHYAKQK